MKEKKCQLKDCKKLACGKQILIQDYGPAGKWLVDVCQEHYESAHNSRKKV